MSIQHYQEGILPAGVDTVLPPEWLFNAPLTDHLGATGSGDLTPTFTRASVATYKNFSDELVAVASGVPRFAARGLFIEGVRTNVMKYSEAFDNAIWIKLSATIAPNSVASPYTGAPVIADTVLEQTANSWHQISQPYTGDASGKDGVSIFARSSGRTWCWFGWWDSGAGWVGQFVNLSTGALGTLDTDGGAIQVRVETEQYTGGWWHLKMVVQTLADTARNFGCGPAISDGVGVYVGSAETVGTSFIASGVEVSVDFVSSYIPALVGSSVTRQQDKLSYPSDGAPLGDGTIHAEVTKYYVQSEEVYYVATTSAIQRQGIELVAKANNRRAIRVWETGPGSEVEIESTPDVYVAFVPNVVWGYFLTNFVTMWVDDTRYGIGLTADMPTVKNRISIGMDGADGNPLWGWIKNVVMYENARAPV